MKTWCLAAALVLCALLVSCSGDDDGGGSTGGGGAVAQQAIQPIFPSATPTPTPALLKQPQQLEPGLVMTPLAITIGSCDGQAALLLEAELRNDTATYRRDIPTIIIRSKDNQELLNFVGFEDHPNFYNLPQGLPPNSTTRGYYCFGVDGRLGRGTYVGQLPSSFGGWIVDSQIGLTWIVQ